MLRSENHHEKLSIGLLNLDEEILAVDIVSYNGDPLAHSLKPEIKDLLSLERGVLNRWATWSVLLVGLSKQFDELLSETEFLVLGRKNFKRVLIPLPSWDIVLGLVLARSAEASTIYDKVTTFIRSDSWRS